MRIRREGNTWRTAVQNMASIYILLLCITFLFFTLLLKLVMCFHMFQNLSLNLMLKIIWNYLRIRRITTREREGGGGERRPNKKKQKNKNNNKEEEGKKEEEQQ